MLNLLLLLAALSVFATAAVAVEDAILRRINRRRFRRTMQWERDHPLPDSSTMPWGRTR